MTYCCQSSESTKRRRDGFVTLMFGCEGCYSSFGSLSSDEAVTFRRVLSSGFCNVCVWFHYARKLSAVLWKAACPVIGHCSELFVKNGSVLKVYSNS